MIWPRLKLIIAAGAGIILTVLAIGTFVLLDRAKRSAMAAAETSLERAAQATENALNRQFLQVHGALASLPTLFGAAGASPDNPQVAGELLRALNFQTLAYRDLLLVDGEGRILASARPRRGRQGSVPDAAALRAGPTALIGPVRNGVTGEWSLYVARTIPAWNGITPVAEVPLSILMEILAEVGIPPGVKLFVERPNGLLIASLPHDEIQTGKIRKPPPIDKPATGRAFVARAPDSGEARLCVVRTSLYGGIRVELVAGLDMMLADWRRDRDRTIAAAVVGGLLICAFAAALLFALRQRERADAERVRAQAVLVNAIEAMSDGFIMWDAQDRLVTCNQRFRELYTASAPYLVPGAHFEDVVRKGAAIGQYPSADGEPDDVDAFVAELLALHRYGHGSIERMLPDGRWILMRERRTADGGVVGTRTDITALKSTLADLADANMRANRAATEAQHQNAALVERESRIRFLAHHDDLTLLPNRILFRELAAEALRAPGSTDESFALLYLDVDRFKDVNDTLGHSVGDALLKEVAARLGACVDQPERVARLGGDEFAVICLAQGQPEPAEVLSRRIIAALGKPYHVLGHSIAISASVGIAVADGGAQDADGLLRQADLALYQAKAQGRGTFCVFAPDMDARLRDRLEMEADLRHALPEGQLALAYQPIYDLSSERLCGFEALLRWNHPRRGVISPSTFIPLAEESRLVVEIGAWVLRQACADARLLPDDLKIAINLSPVQLTFGDIVESVREVLAETGLAPERLELEITETALLASDQRNLEVLLELKAMGVRIVLDDFGTGYSSLSHLRQFPLDKIKIDRLFVRDMTERADCAMIVEGLAALAVRLGMTTTAEGIETDRQWEVACRAGCTEAQGFLLGKPQSIADALSTAASRRLRPSDGAAAGAASPGL